MMNDPKMRDGVAKVVAAGMKVMYSPEMADKLEGGLQGQEPIAEKLAAQVAGLLKLIDSKMGMKIPKQYMIPAAAMLVHDLAAFAKSAMGIEVSEDEIVQAQQMVGEIIKTEYRHIAQQGQQQQPQQQPAPVSAPAPPQPSGGLISGAQ